MLVSQGERERKRERQREKERKNKRIIMIINIIILIINAKYISLQIWIKILTKLGEVQWSSAF